MYLNGSTLIIIGYPITGFKVYNHMAQNFVYDFKCQNAKEYLIGSVMKS